MNPNGSASHILQWDKKTVKYKVVDAEFSLRHNLEVTSLTLPSQMTFLNAEKKDQIKRDCYKLSNLCQTLTMIS